MKISEIRNLSIEDLKNKLIDINRQVSNINNSVGFTLERSKWNLIYERYFPKGRILSNDFEKAVLSAYHDIVSLIPNLDSEGKQDEDYYLGEWLLKERPEYEILAGKSKKDAAYLIYSIRKKQY